MTEDVSQPLLTLASEDRLTLLGAINANKQRLTKLARVINASNQECSRHLSRLAESGLITKGPDGSYETSTLGKAVLRLLPSVQFLFKHRNYMLSHDLSFLSHSFIERIGELDQGQLLGHFNTVLEQIKTTILQARQFVWLIADEPVVPTTSLGTGFPSRSLPVKLILEQGYDLKGFTMAKSLLPSKFEIALAAEVKVAMAINEKMAGVCFPHLNGKIDFGVGFIGSDPQFQSWCRDLFEHYWKTAETVRF